MVSHLEKHFANQKISFYGTRRGPTFILFLFLSFFFICLFVFRVPTRKKKRIVFAFDKDLRRLTLMRRRIDEAGASGAIETRLQDFLEVDTSDKRFAAVGAILLDPSCSGSGIVSAPDRIHENQGAEGEGGSGGDQSRVSRLAAFQLQGLLKAMSFPQVGA